MNKREIKSLFALIEAIWGGIFGTVLCCLMALVPVLLAEQNIPILPRGNQSVIIILAVCLLVESTNLWRIWRAVFDSEYPFGPAAALRYQPFRNHLLRAASVVWYLFHFCFAILFVMMCKYMAIHGATTSDRFTGLFFGLAMFGAVNLFFSLTLKACNSSNGSVMTTWRYRFAMDLLIEAAALAIGFLRK